MASPPAVVVFRWIVASSDTARQVEPHRFTILLGFPIRQFGEDRKHAGLRRADATDYALKRIVERRASVLECTSLLELSHETWEAAMSRVLLQSGTRSFQSGSPLPQSKTLVRPINHHRRIRTADGTDGVSSGVAAPRESAANSKWLPAKQSQDAVNFAVRKSEGCRSLRRYAETPLRREA